jgi:hypothetical protein
MNPNTAKKMNYRTVEGVLEATELIREEDLVLLDTNIIGRCSIDNRNDCVGLFDTLYEVRGLIKLERYQPYINEARVVSKTFLDKIVRQDNVFTIPEVIEELKLYHKHLQENLEFLGNRYKLLKKEQHNFLRQPRRESGNDEKSLSVRKRNQTRDKLKRKNGELSFLDSLNSFASNLNTIMEELKVYDGPFVQLKRNAVQGASEADYRLVEAGVGYVASKDFKAKMYIASRDRHIRELLHYAFN